MKYILLTIFFASFTLFTACEKTPAPSPAPGVQTISAADPVSTTQTCEECERARDYQYSPFYVTVSGGEHYHTITFKDVGLLRTDHTIHDPLLEVIAESISQELANGALGYHAEVAYDHSLADPSNHRACGDRHVYVDVWNRDETTWGYSLWSGCGEDDNFAWKEVKGPAMADGELYERVEPLARSIHNSLQAAEQTECFRKSC